MGNLMKAEINNNAKSILVAIPATSSHRPIVEISLPRLKAQLRQADFLIVSPSPEAFMHLADEHTRIAPDDEFSVLTKAEVAALLVPQKQKVAGWYYQQLLKYSIVAQSKFDRVLILDADTVVLRDIQTSDCEFFTSKERHRPYFDHFEALFGARPPLKSSAITNFMWFNPLALCEMLSEIEARHHKLWWTAIIDIANPISEKAAFSEYETYANWFALYRGPHTEIPINIFRRGDLLTSKDLSQINAVSAAINKNYEAITFEINHPQTNIKRFFAWVIVKIGFKLW